MMTSKDIENDRLCIQVGLRDNLSLVNWWHRWSIALDTIEKVQATLKSIMVLQAKTSLRNAELNTKNKQLENDRDQFRCMLQSNELNWLIDMYENAKRS